MILSINDEVITNEGSGRVTLIQGDNIHVQLRYGKKTVITHNDIVALAKGDGYQFNMILDSQPR